MNSSARIYEGLSWRGAAEPIYGNNRVLEWAAVSHIGLSRSINQDAVAIYDFQKNGNAIFLIADGMGGHLAGEVASQIAAEGVVELYLSRQEQEWGRRLLNALEETNRRILDSAASNNDYQGMGTTCVSLALENGSAYVANVGDSRAYRIRNGEIEQLTEDHSPLWEMVKRGELTKREARQHRGRNLISRSLGLQPRVGVDLSQIIPTVRGDLFLLCSDGLSSEMDDEDILEVLRNNPSLPAGCGALIAEANQRGGHDNVSVVLVKVLAEVSSGGTRFSPLRVFIAVAVLVLGLMLAWLALRL